MHIPQYRHDCDGCHFLGEYRDGEQSFDLYHCRAPHNTLASKQWGVILSRWGNEKQDVLALPIATLQQPTDDVRPYRALVEGLKRYMATYHEIQDVVVRGWRCQLYVSPIGFVTIRAIDEDLEVFVDCVAMNDVGIVDEKTLRVGVTRAIEMMREKIENAIQQRRLRWRKRP